MQITINKLNKESTSIKRSIIANIAKYIKVFKNILSITSLANYN